jgi:molybdopterin/thiamine biosynthesis adenylyltransferase
VSRAQTRVLIVGVGGIGCPAALAMARAGVRTIGLCDDDKVERGNLHRQILFTEMDADARIDKVDAAAKALRAMGCSAELRLHRTRLLPGNAADLVREYDIVLEGADNFATKFLAADACVLSGIPVVHASAVRWVATALAVGPRGGPCYRCLFEDLPADGAPGCADAGVMGPVVGIIAAAQSDLALALIDGIAVGGQLVTFDGRADVFRRRAIAPRHDCDLCGARPRIRRVESQAYLAPSA